MKYFQPMFSLEVPVPERQERGPCLTVEACYGDGHLEARYSMRKSQSFRQVDDAVTGMCVTSLLVCLVPLRTVSLHQLTYRAFPSVIQGDIQQHQHSWTAVTPLDFISFQRLGILPFSFLLFANCRLQTQARQQAIYVYLTLSLYIYIHNISSDWFPLVIQCNYYLFFLHIITCQFSWEFCNIFSEYSPKCSALAQMLILVLV